MFSSHNYQCNGLIKRELMLFPNNHRICCILQTSKAFICPIKRHCFRQKIEDLRKERDSSIIISIICSVDQKVLCTLHSSIKHESMVGNFEGSFRNSPVMVCKLQPILQFHWLEITSSLLWLFHHLDKQEVWSCITWVWESSCATENGYGEVPSLRWYMVEVIGCQDGPIKRGMMFSNKEIAGLVESYGRSMTSIINE